MRASYAMAPPPAKDFPQQIPPATTPKPNPFHYNNDGDDTARPAYPDTSSFHNPDEEFLTPILQEQTIQTAYYSP